MKKNIYKILIVFIFIFLFGFITTNVKAEEEDWDKSFYFTSDPYLDDTYGFFDTASIDFYINQDARETYWALWDWTFDLDDFIEENGYASAEGAGGYCGIQTVDNEKKALMSIWQTEYSTNGSNKKILNATNVYPGNEGTFDNEGSGVQKFINYNWKTKRWYRMVIHSWYDKQTNHTFAGTWIQDLTDNKWTLLTYYDTNIKHTCFSGSMEQFQENFDPDYAYEVREMFFKNIYLKEIDNDDFISINKSFLDYYYDYGHKGRHEFGSTGEYFYALTGGTVSNQQSYDASSIQGQYFTINQPDEPNFGDLNVSNLSLSSNKVNWQYSTDSTPQESVNIEITNLDTGNTSEVEINRPEVRSYTVPGTTLKNYNIKLVSTDIFGNQMRKDVVVDNRSTVNTLKSLTVSGANIDFSPTTNTYNVTVENDVDSVTIASMLTDSKSKYVSGFGNRTVSLDTGVNEVLIKVESEAGTVNVYTINITRKSNIYLNNILINNIPLTDFRSDIYSYDIQLNSLSVNITTTQNDGYTVEGIGEHPLQLGQNIITLKVTDQDNNSQNYILNIITEKKEPYLESILVNSKLIDNFNKETFSYNLNIDGSTALIEATPEFPQQCVVSGDIGNKNLKYGNNLYQIKVRNNNFNEEKTYILNINRPDNRNTDYTLKSLSLSVGSIDFKPDVNTYDVYVDSSVDSVVIKSDLGNDKATYVDNYGNREVKLSNRVNPILIKVKAENETVNTYTINVIRNQSNASIYRVPNTKKTNSILLVLVSLVTIISGILIINKYMRRRKLR